MNKKTGKTSLLFLLTVTTLAQASGLLSLVNPLGSYLQNKTFFARYLWQSAWNSSVATKQEPFLLPNESIKTENIAQELHATLQENDLYEQFLLGASTSEHQCSNQCNPDICSWSRFAEQNNLAQPTDSEYPIDLWQNYKAYIDFAKDKLNLNALRFSVEWALVQPTGPEEYDQEALDHYADLFIYAIKRGITPLMCFHHYTDPCWFIDRGGFEKTKNILYFVQFCAQVYEHIMSALSKDAHALKALQTMSPRQPLWITYNSPEGYAFKGYRQMEGPPANPHKKGLNWVALVLKNMMEAHVQVYYKLNQTYTDQSFAPEITKPQIGFLKNVHQLDSAKKSLIQWCCSPLTRTVCSIADMLQNECIYNFFTRGTFNVQIPLLLNISYTNPHAIGALDFIGLNYYSNRYMFLAQTLQEQDTTHSTDNKNYRVYPHGLYRAIAELSERMAQPLSIPIYVTENGIATTDDNKRNRFYQQYLYALNQAVTDGYPVNGYLTWTLADNYEWPSVKKKSKRVYGLCAVDEHDPAKLIIKDGAQAYRNFVKEFFSN